MNHSECITCRVKIPEGKQYCNKKCYKFMYKLITRELKYNSLLKQYEKENKKGYLTYLNRVLGGWGSSSDKDYTINTSKAILENQLQESMQ